MIARSNPARRHTAAAGFIAALSEATQAAYALILADPGPPRAVEPRAGGSEPGSGSWSPWSPRAAPQAWFPARPSVHVTMIIDSW
jgi:hypothetical protein